MTKTQAWITAFRLRTLPLSVSGVITGSFIALSKGVFEWKIFVPAIATTLFLQILSNLANDYGDGKNGKDNDGRIGPDRMVQSGTITLPEMKRMILLFCGFSLITGVSLIIVSNIILFSASFFVLFGLGLMAIWAALSYTIGQNPYGYYGWGDFSVFIFFGLFSVVGTYVLYSGSVSYDIFLPAVAIGAFSVGVLNMNNIRDHENDMRTGKKTLVVKIGPEKAKIYHVILLASAIISSLIYIIVNRLSIWAWLFIAVLVPVSLHIKRILKIQEYALFDLELKKLAFIALLFSLVFGIGINL